MNPGAPAGAAAPPASQYYTEVWGNMLDPKNPSTIIVHQANCKTNYAAGVAKFIYDTWPEADCYTVEDHRPAPLSDLTGSVTELH